jgi:hypothetical protein
MVPQKTLLTFLSPNKKFDADYNDNRMVEAQIDNSLLYWNPKDILFTTNFPFEYHGVKSLIVPDELYYAPQPKSNKVNIIIYLLENNLLPELTWFHGLDAFQLAPIDITLQTSMGIADYGFKPMFNTDSIFFTPQSLEVFRLIQKVLYMHKTSDEEIALWKLYGDNYRNINAKFEKINNSYNIGMRQTDYVISLSEKPLIVAHFPPHWPDVYAQFKPILTPELIKIIDEKFYAITST